MQWTGVCYQYSHLPSNSHRFPPLERFARALERSAFWLEPLKTLLIRYSPTTLCRLHLSLFQMLARHNSKEKNRERANFCESVSIFLSCSFVPLYIYFFIASFCCLLIRLSFVISQKICLQCCKT